MAQNDDNRSPLRLYSLEGDSDEYTQYTISW